MVGRETETYLSYGFTSKARSTQSWRSFYQSSGGLCENECGQKSLSPDQRRHFDGVNGLWLVMPLPKWT